jgi:DNA-binding transcriptional regulator YhcF (GntR family)
MDESEYIQAIFKIDGRRKEPKSKQIINSVSEAVKKELIHIGERLPSLNNVSFELDVSKDTVQRAYIGLCERGIIESVPGKGFYVKAKPSDTALKILLVFNKLTAYKKTIYNAFMRTINTQASIDFHVHDYDPQRFENIIKSNLDRYDYYVIMPFFFSLRQKYC